MQTLSVDRLVGQTLGNYRVERLMGQGRLSAVYFAQNTLTNINGALTLFIVPERFSQDARARFIQRFRKEATALTALQHAHVLPVHEYGECQGHPYLVTPYMTNGSLADVIKRQGRYEYTDVLDILEQLVAGLEYAHRRGVIHGTLKPSNIVSGDDQTLLVAGFGLMHMLQMRGVEQDDRPYGHLFSIAETFLAAPEYIAPEIVQGQSIDKRSDIYALGIILFELLNGKPPFSGQKPLDVAKMHIQQSIPSLRTLHPDIPMAVISVVNQALDRDPARRFQSASELAEAFAQAVVGASGNMRRRDRNDDLPETPARGYSTSNWQLMPPIVTGKMAAMNTATTKKPASVPSELATENSDAWQLTPPVVTGHLEAAETPRRPEAAPSRVSQPESPLFTPPVKPRPPAYPTFVPPLSEPAAQRIASSMQPEPPVPVRKESRPEEKRPEWWEQSSQSSGPLVLPGSEANPWEADQWEADQWEADQWGDAPAWSQPVTGRRSRSFTSGRRTHNNKTRTDTRSAGRNIGRRKVVALLATGGVVAAGVLIGARMHLGSQPTSANTTPQQPQGQQGNTAPAPAKKPGNTAPAPTQKPVAAGQGVTIGSTTMALNTAVTFNNQQDLLIRLPDGRFVAYNRACTHQQVPINYDPATQKMVCPAHGAIFDPAQNAKVLLGPAATPVAAVKISVNANGTITMV